MGKIMVSILQIRRELLELEQTLRELNHDISVSAYVQEEVCEKKLSQEIQAVVTHLSLQKKKGNDSVIGELVKLYEIIKDAKKQRNKEEIKEKLGQVTRNLEIFLQPIRTTDIAEEAILDVSMGEFAILFPNCAQRFLRTYGVTTCTVCVIGFPRIHVVALCHLAPNVGMRFLNFLEKIKEEVNKAGVNSEREECLFYLNVHPYRTLFNPSEWLKSEERRNRTPEKIKEYFPKLRAISTKEIKVVAGVAIDVIVDKNSCKTVIYNSSFVDAEFPKRSDF